MLKKIKRGLGFGLAMVLVIDISLAQDEISKAIDQAKAAYSKKSYLEVTRQLQIALQLTKQLVANELKSFLPQPFADWQADEPEVTFSETPFHGVPISARRHYFRRGKQETVDVRIEVNSPRSAAATIEEIATPQLWRPGKGIELVTIGGVKGIERFDPDKKTGDLRLVPGYFIQVRIDSKGIGKDALRLFASKIDLTSLRKKFETKILEQ